MKDFKEHEKKKSRKHDSTKEHNSIPVTEPKEMETYELSDK